MMTMVPFAPPPLVLLHVYPHTKKKKKRKKEERKKRTAMLDAFYNVFLLPFVRCEWMELGIWCYTVTGAGAGGTGTHRQYLGVECIMYEYMRCCLEHNGMAKRERRKASEVWPARI